jgi:hypothetical protein
MKPIKAVAVAIDRDQRTPHDVHIVVADSKGRVWERYATMTEGAWGVITLPNEPQVQPRRARVSKLRRRQP